MKDLKPLFDFDDILIVPTPMTNINSRYKDVKLDGYSLPLMTAPMDTVVNMSNYKEFVNNGITVTLPRTVSYGDYLHYYLEEEVKGNKMNNIFVSMGFSDIERHLKSNLVMIAKGQHLLIDVANGHMAKIFEYSKKIKKLRPDIILMVGNIGNPETYLLYAEETDVDYIRVGIGNGGGCLTTKQSGVGYPMATLISETHKNKLEFEKYYPNKKAPAIVADGGMKNYSDIIKALALGADYVMIGSVFNKALESCSPNYFHGIKVGKKTANYLFNHGYTIKKYFRGMSTKEAQKAMGKTNIKTSEGVVRFRKVEYHLDGWTKNFIHYLRNAMSYNNADKLSDFIGKVQICEITKNAYDRFNK